MSLARLVCARLLPKKCKNIGPGITNNVVLFHERKSAENTEKIAVKPCHSAATIGGNLVLKKPPVGNEKIIYNSPLQTELIKKEFSPYLGKLVRRPKSIREAEKPKLLMDYTIEDMENPEHAIKFYTLAMNKKAQLSNENKQLRAKNDKLEKEIDFLKNRNTDCEGPLATNRLLSQRAIAKWKIESKAEAEPKPSTSKRKAAKLLLLEEQPASPPVDEKPKVRPRFLANPFRIVELEHFINSLLALQHQHWLACPKGKLTIFSEKLNGTTGDWTFMCSVCGQQTTISTSSPLNITGGESTCLKWLASLSAPLWNFTQQVFTQFKIPFYFYVLPTVPKMVKCNQTCWYNYRQI